MQDKITQSEGEKFMRVIAKIQKLKKKQTNIQLQVVEQFKRIEEIDLEKSSRKQLELVKRSVDPHRTYQVFQDMKKLLDATLNKMESDHRNEAFKVSLGIKRLESKISEKAEASNINDLETQLESLRSQIMNLALNTSLHHEQRLNEIQKTFTDPTAEAVAWELLNCSNQITNLKQQFLSLDKRVPRRNEEGEELIFQQNETEPVEKEEDLFELNQQPTFLQSSINQQGYEEQPKEQTKTEMKRNNSELTQQFGSAKWYSRPSTSHSHSRGIFLKHRVEIMKKQRAQKQTKRAISPLRKLSNTLTAKSIKLSEKQLKIPVNLEKTREMRSLSPEPEPTRIDSANQTSDNQIQMRATVVPQEGGSRMIGMTGFKMGADRKSKTNVRKYSESYGREPLADVLFRTKTKRKSIDSINTEGKPSSQSFSMSKGPQLTNNENYSLTKTEHRSLHNRRYSQERMLSQLSRPQTSHSNSRKPLFPGGILVQGGLSGTKGMNPSSSILVPPAGAKLVKYQKRKQSELFGEREI